MDYEIDVGRGNNVILITASLTLIVDFNFRSRNWCGNCFRNRNACYTTEPYTVTVKWTAVYLVFTRVIVHMI